MRRLYPHILLVLALIAGCTASTPATEKPTVNLSGYPPAFRDGYLDGCYSAHHPGKLTRDEDRYKDDSMYAAGWRDGRDICSDKKYD